MVNFAALGYSTFEEYLQDFKQTLLKTLHTYDFFVNWTKAESNAYSHVIELGLLNSLTLVRDYSERRELLRRLIVEHPKIVTVIPHLLAVRDSSVEVADIMEQVIYKRYDFSLKTMTQERIEDLLTFCEKTGVLELLGKIKDAYTYMFGVEVGLDSNARKNRSGEVFKNVVSHLLEMTVKKLSDGGQPFSYQSEVELQSIVSYPKQKKADFVIYYSQKPIVACEANVFHAQGSKPLETARTYDRMEELLKKSRVSLMWFTDGPGWNVMWNQFKEAAKSIEYVLNYQIASTKLYKILPLIYDDLRQSSIS